MRPGIDSHLKDLRRETALRTLPIRKSHLQNLEEIRDRILQGRTEIEDLLLSTLCLESQEETHLRRSLSLFLGGLTSLDKGITLLEENIRRVEDGGEI